MNIKLLKKIKNAILKAPLRFNMDWWVKKHRDGLFIAKSALPPCGTTACIAGHALALAQKKPLTTSFWLKQKEIVGNSENNSPVSRLAGKLLDLNTAQRRRLFFVREWPSQFELVGYPHKREATRNAKVAARRIDHFIKTKGKQ